MKYLICSCRQTFATEIYVFSLEAENWIFGDGKDRSLQCREDLWTSWSTQKRISLGTVLFWIECLFNRVSPFFMTPDVFSKFVISGNVFDHKRAKCNSLVSHLINFEPNALVQLYFDSQKWKVVWGWLKNGRMDYFPHSSFWQHTVLASLPFLQLNKNTTPSITVKTGETIAILKDWSVEYSQEKEPAWFLRACTESFITDLGFSFIFPQLPRKEIPATRKPGVFLTLLNCDLVRLREAVQ